MKKKEIDDIIDEKHVDLPEFNNFYVEEIANKIDEDPKKKSVYLKDIHMINLIRKLSNFSIDEFTNLKTVKDVYYNRDILIDLDSIPNIIINNEIYPKDLIEEDITNIDEIKENTDVKNFNRGVMNTIYALYTDVRLD